MNRGSSPNPLRLAACAVFAAVVALAFAACGDESEQKLSFELSGKGKAVELTAPESADSGEAEITFANNSDRDGELQLIRVEGDHNAEEVVEGLEAAQAGKPFPDWFFAGGGVSTTKPGESITVTQVLEPGTYFATDTEAGKPDPSQVPAVDVSGDQSDTELSADARVEAGEYSFTAEGLTAGENQIDFANIGAQPHHLIVAPIKGDTTIEEVEQAIKVGKGPPPIEEKGLKSTAVIEGGESQLVEMDLEPGRYALLCFISDRQGGPPHALKGMIDEVEID